MLYRETFDEKVIKQFISTVLGVAITSSSVPFTSVQAEEIITEKYPYTLFAGSSDEGAININSNNVCINGNIATNGTITTTAGNFNINGIKAENVDEPIIYFFNKLDTAYFDTSATATYSEDYFCEETNININTPIEAEGDITLKGNINISSGLKALNDVNLSGNVENTQHSAISSQTGDIIINTDNVNLNGIVYAPYGCVNISAMNLNMNSVIIIADKINISCPNFNANYNIQMGEFIGLESEETEYDTELNDSDKDGLPDIFETKLGTDIEDSDTDGDELTDYEEFFITGTDPTIYDSVHEGISDSDADCDEDGLCNIDEIARGTDPRDSDTDLDGLTDYDEIFIYNTDPLVADSDNDSIDDGSEVKLGLDPNNALTYGIPDGEYKISQVITADNGILSAFNTEESPYTLSIEMKTNRDIEKEISVSNSGYSNVISNDAMIGASLDISLSDNCDPEDIVLRYDIKERATENTLDKYSSLSELQGIRRLNVFKFDEEERMLIPVETKFSEDNKQLYAEVDELGTYCIMDMEIWLNELGVEMPESVDPAISLNQMSNIQIMAAAPKNTEPLYLLFMLQTNYIPVETAASYEQKLNSEINTIKSLSKYAFDKYKALDVHVQVLTYTDITASPMLNSKGENYFTDYNELCSNLDTIQYRATLSEANRKNAYMMAEIKCEVLKHPNTFACLFTNSYTVFSPQISNGYFFDDALYWSKWQTVKTYCSRVYLNKEDFKRDSPYFFDIKEIYENAQDEEKEFAPTETALDTSNDSNYEALRDCLIKHVEHLYGVTAPKEDNSFDIIVPTRWKKITLKGTLSPDNGIDTDGDTLTDWEEVDTTKIKINTDNSIELPTFTIAAMVEHLSRFNSADYNFLTRDNAPRLYLPIISDPTMIDSDGDGLLDGSSIDYIYDVNIKRQVAPKDPEPLLYTGLFNLWNTQIKQIDNSNICHYYNCENNNTDVKINQELADFLVKNLLKYRTSINNNEDALKNIAIYLKYAFNNTDELSADLLNFLYDENNVAYHSKPETWQRNFGYNDLYDEIFKIGSTMYFGRIDFKIKNELYAIWVWKGDYWSLKSGAEVGIYKFDDNYYETNQYSSIDFEVPMTLSLYNYNGNGIYDNIFNWIPEENQWWITGFNINYIEPQPQNMVVVASIDLSEHEDLFNGIIDSRNVEYLGYISQKNIIYDVNSKMIWLQWYN
ncbi:DUF4474 domain-containing protein [Ruminococcus sp. XPD3002]|uniref:DUF4474 domain-containing protein n=1 Tax=Ruminococcus sp. XPD3002 TaxID=1452269 RepID=UPI00091875BA|nr:protein of unknown function [Ruminococcus flavefaciens]